MGAGFLRCEGNDNGCAVAGADATRARGAHIRRSHEGSDGGYLEEFVEQGRWVIVTAAASVHVRTAWGDKAFDEASSRGLALNPSGCRGLCRESSARSACSDQRNESIRAVDVRALRKIAAFLNLCESDCHNRIRGCGY